MNPFYGSSPEVEAEVRTRLHERREEHQREGLGALGLEVTGVWELGV